MPFEVGNTLGNRFTSENQPPPESKTHGPRRSDIARKVLNMKVTLDQMTFEQLSKSYPEITQTMTGEELAYIIQLNKSIVFQDTPALKLLLDSAYGQPSQPITGAEGEPLIPPTKLDPRDMTDEQLRAYLEP